MKKYETTKENPIFKEGLFVNDMGKEKVINVNFNHLIEQVEINGYHLEIWLEKGYIKEVQKKEFTKSDMIDLLKYVSSDFSVFSLTTFEDDVENYLKQRSK